MSVLQVVGLSVVLIVCSSGTLEAAEAERFGNLHINMLNDIHNTIVTSRQQKQAEFDKMKEERVKQREELEKEKSRLQDQLKNDREKQFQEVKKSNLEQHDQFKGVLYQIMRTIDSAEEKKLGFNHMNLLRNISDALELSKQDSIKHFEHIVQEDMSHHEKAKQKIKDDQVQLIKERNKQFQELRETAVNQHEEIKTIFKDIMSLMDQAKDCYELLQSGIKKSGIYVIRPDGVEKNFYVYCDMDTDGGGWTVIQRRKDFGVEAESFNRKWSDYKDGFGKLSQEFWLGNDKISALTTQKEVTLKVELQDYNQNPHLAFFNTFKVDNEQSNYKLTLTGYSGKSVQVFTDSNGQMFSTPDRNSSPEKSCALSTSSGWWFNKDCAKTSNLNGIRQQKSHVAILWDGQTPIALSEMKIRPVQKKKTEVF